MPSFDEIKAILDRLVAGKSAYLKDTHGQSFGWANREELLAAIVEVPSGSYRLIDEHLIGTIDGGSSNLVISLKDQNGVDGNGQMPFEGDISGEYATDDDITTIVEWISEGCPN